MMPLLPDGSRVIVRGNPGRIRLGDIVVIRGKNGDFCLHRVIRIDSSKFTTKGDNSVFPDPPVSRSQISGIALFHVEKPGKVWNIRPLRASREGISTRILRNILLLALRSRRLRASRLTENQLTAIGFRKQSGAMHVQNRFEIQKLGRKLMVYDHQNDELHTLNETATLIWELLKKNKTESQIVDTICETYQTDNRELVQSDVKDALEQLEKLEILTN